MSNKRIEWIDSTRGIAILLVVVGHVVGGYTGNYGLPEYQRIIDIVVDVIYTFHMPLFFMISGYVFGLKNIIGQWIIMLRILIKKQKLC